MTMPWFTAAVTLVSRPGVGRCVCAHGRENYSNCHRERPVRCPWSTDKVTKVLTQSPLQARPSSKEKRGAEHAQNARGRRNAPRVCAESSRIRRHTVSAGPGERQRPPARTVRWAAPRHLCPGRENWVRPLTKARVHALTRLSLPSPVTSGTAPHEPLRGLSSRVPPSHQTRSPCSGPGYGAPTLHPSQTAGLPASDTQPGTWRPRRAADEVQNAPHCVRSWTVDTQGRPSGD